MDRIQAHRLFFANLITANAGISQGSELAAAFASTPREQFVGPPPWRVFTRQGYIETLSDDPAFLYQDVVVSLGSKESLNNGQPSLHAHCIAALAPAKGERTRSGRQPTGLHPRRVISHLPTVSKLPVPGGVIAQGVVAGGRGWKRRARARCLPGVG